MRMQQNVEDNQDEEISPELQDQLRDQDDQMFESPEGDGNAEWDYNQQLNLSLIPKL